MISAVVLLLAASAPPVTVIMPRADGIRPDERSRLLADVAAAIETETDRPTRIEASSLASIRQSSPTLDVVTVDVAAGVRLTRIDVELHPGAGDPVRVQIDIERDPNRWVPRLRGVARILFADLAPSPPPTIAAPANMQNDERGAGPAIAWSAVGVGVAAGVTAAILRGLAESYSHKAISGPDDAFDLQANRSRRYGMFSNVGFVVSAALVAGGGVYLLAAP